MKFQPNICIIDMAHMVVAHGNKRKSNMFLPNDGMISEISEENIEKALFGTLSVSLPWLEKEYASTPSVIDDVHPVTGSGTRFCLFDRFHERNTVKRKEILRRVTHIKELKGVVNTQRDEQLHAAHRYDSCFLNVMIPVNHIFLLCSIIDLKNATKNICKIQETKLLSKHEVYQDSLGRLMLSKKTLRSPFASSIMNSQADSVPSKLQVNTLVDSIITITDDEPTNTMKV